MVKKLKLGSRRKEAAAGLELEVAREQAASLGRAGKRLQLSIDAFNRAIEREDIPCDDAAHSSAIAARAWELMVQRELVGFTQDNLQWVIDRFEIPDAALRKLGRPERIERRLLAALQR